MTSKLTRERIELIANFHRAMTLPPSHAEIEELARMALAAMDSEPVAFTDERNLGYIDRGRETAYLWGKQNSEASDVALYRHAQPAVDSDFIPKNLDKALGVVGVAIPESREEFNLQAERWIQRLIDRVIRYADEFQEQPALVVPDEIKHRIGGLDWGWEGEFNRGWNACRAAMLERQLVDRVDEKSLTSINPAPDLVSLQKKAEPIIGNYPAIPDGYVMVPKEPTKQMILAGQEELESCIDNGFDSDIDGNRYDYTDIVPDAPHRVFMAMLAAALQEGK